VLIVDVLIVGGGPAGASLGYLLQKSGIRCCIIDRSCFPREKLCGGLLTQKTVDLISEIYGESAFPYERITSNVDLHLGTHKISSVTADSKFYLVERTDFDHYFIMKYLDCHGTLLEGATLSSVDLKNKIATVNKTDKITFKVIVGADGANSHIRKHVDENYRPEALCLEGKFFTEDINDNLCIYFSAARSGYGWCFPKNGHYTVGIGGLIKKNKDIKHIFNAFTKRIGKQIDEANTTGALIPFGKYVRKPCKDNILLLGDAAGLVDPITGEGLYFAFLSAVYASESIVEHLHGRLPLSASYFKRVELIHARIDDANRFNKIFFRDITKPFFLRLIDGKKNITKYVCDNLLSYYNVSYMGFAFQYRKVRQDRKKSERKNAK